MWGRIASCKADFTGLPCVRGQSRMGRLKIGRRMQSCPTHQKMYLNPNCISRIVRAEVIFPKVED